MKILYIHQYFKTPNDPGGTRSYWIARKLIEAGHEVTMLATKTSESPGPMDTTIDGISVKYLQIPYDNRMSLPQRLMSFVKFMIGSTKIAFQIKNIDLVIATSTPLTVGFPALLLKKWKTIPYIFEVRDLWPEVPIKMGALRNPLVVKLALKFERLIYKHALHIVALSPGMAAGVVSVVKDANKVSIIPNMSKIDKFYPREKNSALNEKYGLDPNSFKLIHFGTLGLANGAMSIIEGAVALKGKGNFEFVFLGGGSTEDKLIARCRAEGLTNVHFLGKFSMDMTSELVNLCDVSIVSFLDLPILYTNSPNKLFDSLSAGKPIIVNSAGWTKDLVESFNCGYYVDPHQPNDLADKLIYLSENPNIVKQMGCASRQLAEKKFDKEILCAQFVDLVKRELTKQYV